MLALCVLISGTHTAFLKVYQKKNGSATPISLLFTSIMTSTIAATSIIVLYVTGGQLTWNTASVLLSLLMGFLYTINLPLGAIAYELGSIALSGVFLQLGSLLIPFLYGAIFLGEFQSLELPSLILRLVGVLTAILTIFVQLPKKSEKGKMSLKFFFVGICMMLVNGIFCAIVKAQSKFFSDVAKPQVMFYAGVFGAVCCGIFLIFLQLTKKTSTDGTANTPQKTPFALVASVPKKLLLLPVCYGFFNSAVNLINLVLGSRIDATVHYPVLSCGGLLVTTLTAFLVFRERITKKHVLTIALCLVTILCFSF